MQYNSITFPGNKYARVLRKLVKGRELYPIPKVDRCKIQGPTSILEISDCLMVPDDIKQLFAPLLSIPNISLIIHGSWGDNTKCAFSDLDDLVIIDDTKINSQGFKDLIHALNTVDMNFCRLDPLQHHGHWITSKKELLAYHNSFIPLFILKDSYSIYGINSFQYCIDVESSTEGYVRNLKNTILGFQYLFKQFEQGKINLYRMKGLVSGIALIPSLIFQILGKEMDKKNAIENANEIFSIQSLEVLNWATQCRTDWDMLTQRDDFLSYKKYTNYFSNPHLWRMFAAKYSPQLNIDFRESHKLNNASIDCFIQESYKYV